MPENEINRRGLLATAGATAAGAALLQEAAVAFQNPAANVADRTAAIRITGLRTTPVSPKAILRIETNHKITGFGEISNVDPKVAAALADSLYELLDGENPTRIEYLWQKLFRSHRNLRGGGFMVHTLSAIDQALWDITGKLWGVPVYRLLGGPVREKVRMYPSAKAIKTSAGGPQPQSGDPPTIRRLVDRVKQARKQVGPDGAVMFDAHCCLPPPTLIQFGTAVEPYELLFLEEPAVPGDIGVFRRIKEAVRIPIATGERDRTIWGILPYLEEGVVDIVQPDVGHTGGISQMKKIAALAEAHYVPLAPHCTSSYLGLSASLHVACSIPLFLIHEAYDNQLPAGIVRKAWTKDEEGNSTLPQGPGLGIEIDEEALAQAAADPARKWQWPTNRYPDGSPADY